MDICLTTKKDKKLQVKGDFSDLENVLTNILINAANAMNHKGKIEITTGSIMIQEEIVNSGAMGFVYSGFTPQNGLHAFVSIKDYGKGIKSDVLPMIFEPYFTTRLNEGGLGLGLAMSYSVVKAMHGFISVESVPEKFTTFTVYLPLVEDRGSNGAKKFSKETKSLDIRGLRCLIVEDELEIRQLLEDSLSLMGVKVVSAADGISALDYIKSGEKFDVIILDLTMPNLDGTAFLEKRSALNDNTPVVVVTGRLDSEILNRCRELGAKVILKKPYKLHELLKALEQLK